MLEITATRDFKFTRIIALCDILVEEERSDLLWLLKNFQSETYFTGGERQTLETYLSDYLSHLVTREGQLTKEAIRKVEDNDTRISIPESGVYLLTIVEDIFKDRESLVSFSRDPKYSKKDNRNKNLENFASFQSAYYESWLKNQNASRFKVKFIRNDKSLRYPRVYNEAPIPAEININLTEESGVYIIQSKNGDIKSQSNPLKLDFDSTCEGLVKGWDSEYKCQRLTYKEAEEKGLLKQLNYNISEEKTYLPFDSEKLQDDLYTVNLRKLPIAPSDINEAMLWLLDLIGRKLEEETTSYLTLKRIRELAMSIIENPLFLEIFPDLVFRLDLDALLEKYKKENSEVYWRIQIAEDMHLGDVH